MHRVTGGRVARPDEPRLVHQDRRPHPVARLRPGRQGELRELAHGLRPSSLDDGLGRALEALTLRGPVRLDWRLNGRALPDDVATTAYFVANEAVADAVKHAEATGIGIVVDEENERLIVTIRDDGRGGVDPVKGSGLSGLVDRVAALGGRLHVIRPPGGGTTVEAMLPCVS